MVFWKKRDSAFVELLQLLSLVVGGRQDISFLMKNMGYSARTRNQVQKYNIFKKHVCGDLITTNKKKRKVNSI